ncbi:MAG TPA: exopolysaccharide biosynthesis polyprenyl glycosylphosphotransferase [Conexibacter sp.]|nr:exopolysaccharide biosynthesis polyprenyl glycosylphosphotransferase [Conexibacter sp.]
MSVPQARVRPAWPLPRRGRQRAEEGRAQASVVARRYGSRDCATRRALLLADTAALLLALGALVIGSPRVHAEPHTLALAPIVLGIVVVFRAYGLYARDTKRISHTTLDELPALFHALVLACPLVWVAARLTPAPDLRFVDVLALSLLGAGFAISLRALARMAIARLLGPERVLLVGDGPPVELIARKLAAHPEYGARPVGVLAGAGAGAEVGARAGDIAGLPVLGPLASDRLAEIAAAQRLDRVVISNSELGEAALLDLLRRCRELRLKVSVLPALVDAMGPSVEIDEVEGMTLLAVNPPVLSRSSRVLKRAMDIAGAGLALVLAAPLLIVIAVAIRRDSHGPVLFRQWRVGQNGRRFQLLKFRTMVADAEERRAVLLAESRDPHWLQLEHDPRITRVGAFLRHSSLDELPQLWNVLRGEMSLVGPRPLIEDEDCQLIGWARSRIDLTPGLTGLWQVLGRTNIPFEEMVKLDYVYVTNWSLWTDVRLLLRTIPVVVARRGVN